MDLQRRCLSAVVTIAHKCSDAELPRVGRCAACLSVAGLAYLSWRRARRAEHGSPIATARSSILLAVISMGYAFFSREDERLELFLKRARLVDDYYEQSNHTLHPSRHVPLGGLQYTSGRWIKTALNERGAEGKDELRFRGVNLPAKTPSLPSQLRSTHDSRDLHGSKRDASFVGRPFPLEEAPTHFRRLSREWGFNLVRLSASWEAVMHEGPGVLDASYLKYVRELVALAGQHGLYVLIDPHQDVWSRFTGGDGAPWWTLDAAGFDTDGSALHDTGSAVLHQFWNLSDGAMPNMMWTNNYWKLATATMFTLFFAGDVYAPGITVENAEPIQQFLQRHYFQFIDALAEAVKDCPNVIGFGTMNEPSNGFVGIDDIREIHAPILHGHVMSAFDSMRLASGESFEVPYYPSPFRYDSHQRVNPGGKTAYKTQEMDVWQTVGVYKIDERTNERALLRPDHFALKPGENFADTYMEPFYKEIRRIITRHNPHLVTYAEPHFSPEDPYLSAPLDLAQSSGIGWAPHWYDAVTLFLGYYSSWLSFDFDWNLPAISPFFVNWTFRKNLFRLKHGEARQSDRIHVIVGETGAPFIGSDGFTLSLDRTLRAMESNDLDYAIWCYESGNDGTGGDLWNGEDLSLLSEGRGRGLAAAVRPYPYQYSAGLTVESQTFDPINETYTLVILDGINNKDYMAIIYLFIPSGVFKDPMFTVSAGSVAYDYSSQNLKWQIQERSMGFHRLNISENK